ncbi:MFS transporter, partial [Salmonella enterica subsp. enterica serovar Montevideo]|nr:MFS transporter [Salmonella enterica subsp. enterica serovar Montevideo]
AAMAWADSEAKFLIIRTLLGAAEAGFFPGMIYLTSQWFPQRNTALWALLIGIGIAFTPCVLPMYPLISGIVLGGRQRLSTGRALL